MKRLTFTSILIAIMVFAVFTPARAGTEVRQMSAITDLLVGTSAVSDTTTAINCLNYDYIGAAFDIDWTSGGDAGGGLVYFEGRVHSTSGTWVKLWVVDLTDSMEVKQDIAWAATLQADASLAVIITAVPVGIKSSEVTTTRPVGGMISNALPFYEIRSVVVDTNWNAVAGITGYWILKK